MMEDVDSDMELITVDEMCEKLMIGKSLAYRLLGSGEIKCFKINRIWKIPKGSVYEYIEKKSQLSDNK